MPAFQAAHHHWIFSILAVILGLEYVLLRYFGRGRWNWAARAETAVLSLMGFLLGMGIVRHATILACFGKCAVKLSGTAVIVAWAFLLHGSEERPGFWNPLRCRLVAAGAFFWGLYLALLGFRIAPWALDVLFFVFALLVWLGRRRGLFFIVALGILAASAARMTGSEWTIIIFNLAWIAALLLGGARRIESWIETRVPRRPRKNKESRVSRVLRTAGMPAASALAAAFALYAIGSILFVTDPGRRRARLLAHAPAASIQDPAALSPLAARLRRHVVFLAEKIGERSAFRPEQQARARDYIVRRLRAAGYAPEVLPYSSEWMPLFGNGTPFYNVEAILPANGDSSEIFVIGAHYDTTLGTPGADDNASGVAVLLEAARLMRSSKPAAEIRFVAFGTEEPPAFGTQNMGSGRYARRLRRGGVRVRGMISLEMLGYYNPKRGAQLYPPFMGLFYPAHGDYVSVVGNWRSRALLRWFRAGWEGRIPLEAAVLPGPLSSLAMSDQLNFWTEGYPALMLSDTAFYRNPHYHQDGDRPDTLDYEKMAVVTRALVGALER